MHFFRDCVIMSNGVFVFSNKCCSLFQNFAGVNKYNVKLLKRNASPNVPVIQKPAVDGHHTGGKVGSKWLIFMCSLNDLSFRSILLQLFWSLLCKFMNLVQDKPV